VSDDRQDQVERADEPEEDVEAHGFGDPVGSPVSEPISATEEPPDVEGHQMGGQPVQGRPIQE
jgi:hypothetical protein